MGDRLATIDMGQRGGGCCAPFVGSLVPIEHNVTWAEVYLPTKWHLDQSSRFATTDMGRKTDRTDNEPLTVLETVAQKLKSTDKTKSDNATKSDNVWLIM